MVQEPQAQGEVTGGASSISRDTKGSTEQTSYICTSPSLHKLLIIAYILATVGYRLEQHQSTSDPRGL